MNLVFMARRGPNLYYDCKRLHFIGVDIKITWVVTPSSDAMLQQVAQVDSMRSLIIIYFFLKQRHRASNINILCSFKSKVMGLLNETVCPEGAWFKNLALSEQKFVMCKLSVFNGFYILIQ